MTANQLDEAAAADYRLPSKRSAKRSLTTSRQRLETEAESERWMLQRGGNARGRQALS